MNLITKIISTTRRARQRHAWTYVTVDGVERRSCFCGECERNDFDDWGNVWTTERQGDHAKHASRKNPAPAPASIEALQHRVDVLTTAMRVVLDLSTNAPGRDVFTNIAVEALADAEAA